MTIDVQQLIAAIGTIPKNGYNAHAGYKYASIDDVLESVRAPLAEQGLTIWCDEDSSEIQVIEGTGNARNRVLLVVHYQMGFSKDGETPAAVERQTIITPYLGAQTSQAVRSYAIKYWLRGKLMLGTGDTDADNFQQTQATEEDLPTPVSTADQLSEAIDSR